MIRSGKSMLSKTKQALEIQPVRFQALCHEIQLSQGTETQKQFKWTREAIHLLQIFSEDLLVDTFETARFIDNHATVSSEELRDQSFRIAVIAQMKQQNAQEPGCVACSTSTSSSQSNFQMTCCHASDEATRASHEAKFQEHNDRVIQNYIAQATARKKEQDPDEDEEDEDDMQEYRPLFEDNLEEEEM